MATPVNVVPSGGVAVTESSVGGTPITIGLPGRGTPVTIVGSGGVPVVFVDAPAPFIIAAVMLPDGETLLLTFSDLIDPADVPDVGDFTVIDEGAGISGPPASVMINGNTVSLLSAAPIAPGDDVLATYVPGSTPLEGLTGVQVPAFTDYPVANP